MAPEADVPPLAVRSLPLPEPVEEEPVEEEPVEEELDSDSAEPEAGLSLSPSASVEPLVSVEPVSWPPHGAARRA